MTAAQGHPGGRDFDFLFGSWHIENERLTARLAGAGEWERFAARATCRPILGGLGNIDDFRPAWPGREGFEGASLRLFGPATGRWRIYWMDNGRGVLHPPVEGRFADGVGELYGDDEHEGLPVRVRFRWSGIAADAARWEQAFSADGGATWETNWIMRFSRAHELSGRHCQVSASRYWRTNEGSPRLEGRDFQAATGAPVTSCQVRKRSSWVSR